MYYDNEGGFVPGAVPPPIPPQDPTKGMAPGYVPGSAAPPPPPGYVPPPQGGQMGPPPPQQVCPLVNQCFLFPFLVNEIIGLPGGKINDPIIRENIVLFRSFQQVPCLGFGPFEGRFVLTRRLSRALNLA